MATVAEGAVSQVGKKAAFSRGIVQETGEQVVQGVRSGGRTRARRVGRGVTGPAARANRKGGNTGLVATTILLLFVSGYLRLMLVDHAKPTPGDNVTRRWVIGTTVGSASLSLFADLFPRSGKYACYLILGGIFFYNAQPLAEAVGLLQKNTKPQKGHESKASEQQASNAASGSLSPVYLRQVEGALK